MRFRLSILIMLLVSLVIGCSSKPAPTQIVLVVTATPENTGAVPLNEETTEAASISSSEATPEATTETTPEAAATATPEPVTTESVFPTPSIGQVYVAEQEFQNGRMFWVRPVDQIWVITEDDEGNQSWQVYEDTFEDGMPERDPNITPPEDLLQPVRGFGMLWRENQDVRDALGWATQSEIGYFANYEYHAGGTVQDGRYVSGPGYHLLENLARTVYRFNEGVWTWEIVESSDG